MNQEKIGKFIQKVRKDKKITQSELAEKLGVSDRTVGNWENGRNMPDLSLFKPLCNELGITINELLSGETIDKKDYQEKFEENIVNTIDYSNKRVNKYSNIVGLLLVIFGLFIAMSAIMIFPSESSWGSIYSVFGIVLFIIGISKLTRNIKIGKRLLLILVIFLGSIGILIFTDYINVKNNNVAPMFRTYSYYYGGDAVIYDTPFYDVILCEKDSKYKSYTIVKNNTINDGNLYEFCLVNKTNRFRKIINQNYEKVTSIRVAKSTNFIDSEHTYATTFNKGNYEVVKDINDDMSIKEILTTLKKANYPHFTNLPGYSYLFQVFVDDKEILEFDYGSMYTEDDSINIIFTENDKNTLNKYIN